MLTHSVTRRLSQRAFLHFFFLTSLLCHHNMLSNATLTEEIFYFIYIFHFFGGVWASWDLTSQGALASAARGADGSGKLQLPLASSYTSDQP